MVDLQNLKNAINNGPFGDEAKQMMLKIIDSSIARGSITSEEQQKVLSIMDLEMAQNDTVQKIHEQAAEAFESFADAVDAKVQTASDNLDAIDKEPVTVPVQETSAQTQVIEPQVLPEVPQPEVPPAETPPWQPPTQ